MKLLNIYKFALRVVADNDKMVSVWNSVCQQHCETVSCHSLHTFKQRLKTCLFAAWTPYSIRRFCDVFTMGAVIYRTPLTYLLILTAF